MVSIGSNDLELMTVLGCSWLAFVVFCSDDTLVWFCNCFENSSLDHRISMQYNCLLVFNFNKAATSVLFITLSHSKTKEWVYGIDSKVDVSHLKSFCSAVMKSFDFWWNLTYYSYLRINDFPGDLQSPMTVILINISPYVYDHI